MFVLIPFSLVSTELDLHWCWRMLSSIFFLQMTSLVISPNISKLLVSHWSQSKFSYAIHLRSWQPSSWLDLPCRWCQYTWCAIARQEDTRSYHSQEWFGSWIEKAAKGGPRAWLMPGHVVDLTCKCSTFFKALCFLTSTAEKKNLCENNCTLPKLVPFQKCQPLPYPT